MVVGAEEKIVPAACRSGTAGSLSRADRTRVGSYTARAPAVRPPPLRPRRPPQQHPIQRPTIYPTPARLNDPYDPFYARFVPSLDMRAHALLVLCAAALAIPAHAAPLAISTVVDVVPMSSVTVMVNGPTEVRDLPMPTGKKENAHIMKSAKLPSFLLHRRGVGFRQADYGVKPNVTFAALRPVEGVEASPSTAATPAAHSRRWEDYAKYGSNDLAADKSPNDLAKVDANPSVTPVAPAPAASALTGDVSKDGSDNNPSSSGSGSTPVRLDPAQATTGSVPVHPDLSLFSALLSKLVKSFGASRYQTSYATHDALADAMGTGPNSTSTVPTAADIEKQQANVEKTDRKLDHGLRRRVLAPASYLSTSAPVRRMKQLARDVVQFVARHAMELNTDALLPPPPDPSKNMSDPYVMQEEQREERKAFFNIDSNKAAPPPPKTPKTPKTPLNTTQVDTATSNTTVPLDNKEIATTTGKAKKAT
ncbi:hypothetical protein C8T65DRAFT_670159 [Cerioporus squamosus]|nr:hypothetical protein C8T65DRAFT_670159 [Cerioporus squamosus]